MDVAKFAVVQDAPIPNGRTDVCSFLDISGYYRRFIRDDISDKLQALNCEEKTFEWTKEADKYF